MLNGKDLTGDLILRSGALASFLLLPLVRKKEQQLERMLGNPCLEDCLITEICGAGMCECRFAIKIKNDLSS